MRITDSQQLTQLTQTDLKGVKSPQTAPKVGDVLNAVVADLLENGLLLDLEGHLVKAEVKDPTSFKLGEQVALKVTQSSAQQILVEKLSPEALSAQASEGPDPVLEALKALELPDSPKGRAALEALNAFKLPLTATNVKNLQQMQSALETLMKQSPESLTAQPELKNLMQMSLKEIAIALQKTSQPLTPGVQPESMATQEDGVMVDPKSAQGVPKDTQSTAKEQTPVGRPELSPAASTAKGPLVGDVKPSLEGSIKGPVGTELTAKAEVSQVKPPLTEIDQLTSGKEKQIGFLMEGLEALKNPKEAVKTLAFLMKLDLPATPQSLFAVGQVFNRTQLKELFNTFFSIQDSEMLPDGVKKDLEAMKELLKQFEPEAFKSQENIKQLTKKLIEAAEQLEQNAQKNMVQSQDQSWSGKAVTETFKAPTLPFILSQFPLMINDKLETLELYVEKRHKGQKIDPEDLRIYLSLSTEKLGQVGAMIEIKLKTIQITFDTIDEKVRDIIAEQGKSLEERLDPFGYKVTVAAQVKTKPTHLRDLHEQFEPISFTRFDKRV